MRGSIPANIHITDGKWHDSNELDEIEPEPYAIYAMDKAYVDFLALYRYHQAGAFWVSRAKIALSKLAQTLKRPLVSVLIIPFS